MSKPKMDENMKAAARGYWLQGHRIVLVKGKQPLHEWKNLQTQEQSPEEFEGLPWAEADGFAIICGVQLNNGLFVGALDVDLEKGGTPFSQDVFGKQSSVLENMRVTRLEETPSRGRHLLYYSHSQVLQLEDERCGIQVLGSGRLCIMSPSKGYMRITDNLPSEVSDLNVEFRNALNKAGLKTAVMAATAAPSVSATPKRKKGRVRFCCEEALKRDNHVDHSMRLAIAAEYKKHGWEDQDVVKLFKTQNDFDENTCLTQVKSADPYKAASCESITQYGYCYPECPKNKKTPGIKGGEEEGRESQADVMVKLAQVESVALFHDERRDPYIRIRKDEALVIMRLRSKEVKTWLSSLLWRDREKAPSSEALSSALNVLEALANDGEEHELHNRVAPGEDGSIWVDLCDEKWRAIHVTRAGWEVVNHPPILFRRYNHQQLNPIPVHGGSLAPILDYANITHLGDQLLYVVTAITNLIPSIPHVVIILFGPQGSGKTWALRTIRLLIDPSQLDLLSLPTRYVELVQNLDHNWCAFYDNIGSLPPWQSNVFCRAVTGGGVSKRQLYTDDDDVIYQYHRCVGLTDINIAAERGDLLQRSLLLGLDAIPKDRRKTESELRAQFAQDQPKILGGMLDVLVKALNLYPTIKLQSLHRMADYTVWGYAITQALGIEPQNFIKAYEENITAQNLEAVRASPISDALVRLMDSNPLGWNGTASQLYSVLEEQAKSLKISTRQKAWPKKPHILSRILNELAPSLSAVGLEIERDRAENARLIHISTVPSVQSVRRQSDWGKGGDLKAYLTDALYASYGSFESLSGNQSGTVGANNLPKTTLGEMLKVLRERFPRKFVEVEFSDYIQKSRWTQTEGEDLLKQLGKEGQIFKNTEGAWMWT